MWKCNILDNGRAMTKLQSACEVSKHVLSTLPTAKCSIDSLYDGIDFHTNISRCDRWDTPPITLHANMQLQWSLTLQICKSSNPSEACSFTSSII